MQEKPKKEKKEKAEVLKKPRQAAKKVVDKAAKAVDKNDDGKFDLADVAVMAGGAKKAVEEVVKKATKTVKDNAENMARMHELSTLRPIFPEPVDGAVALTDEGFKLPELILIADPEKKFANSAVCDGAIGCLSEPKKGSFATLFRNSVDAFHLKFHPYCDYGFYYRNPSADNSYIALDEYFSYLLLERIAELQKLAQDLGAKHFKVTYMEEKATIAKKKVGLTVKAPGAKGEAKAEVAEIDERSRKVMAETRFPGHTPEASPQLRYLKNDPIIRGLVEMRMNTAGPLEHQKLTLKMSHSCGLNAAAAAKVDTVLNGLKCAGNVSFKSETEAESRRQLEYEISF